MLINHTAKQVTAKIVYYGPGLSGKTTNLKHIYSTTNPDTRGELVSMETTTERTLFFDLLPLEVGLVKGYQIGFQLYTVPGQVFYDNTRRLVLKGADGIVFVADSQELMAQANKDSMENLKENLALLNMSMEDIPIVLQFNKRDLKNLMPVDELLELLDIGNWPYFEAKSNTGEGVIETLRAISTLTLVKIKDLINNNLEESKGNVSEEQKENVEETTIEKKEEEEKKVTEQYRPPQALVDFDTDPKWMLKKKINPMVYSDNFQDFLTEKNEETQELNIEEKIKIKKNKKLLKSKVDINAELDLLSVSSRAPKKKARFFRKKISIGDSNKLEIVIKNLDGNILEAFPISLKELPVKLNVELDVKK